MRTTIELDDEQRAALLHLAARRGMKGFSEIVKEALDRYLEEQSSRQALIETALSLKGALRGQEAENLAKEVDQLRSHWR